MTTTEEWKAIIVDANTRKSEMSEEEAERLASDSEIIPVDDKKAVIVCPAPYKDGTGIDIRIWRKTHRYEGPTPTGIRLPSETSEALPAAIQQVLDNIAD